MEMRVCMISSVDMNTSYGSTTRPYYISKYLVESGCEILHICMKPPEMQEEGIKYFAKKYAEIYMRKEKIVAKVFDSQADTYGASTTTFGQFLADFEKKRILREFTDTKGLLLNVGTGWGREGWSS